ncbi:MAG: thioredoxin family protein [Bdellovibrionales bacterium]|nr:thioredoxin family protein [Bdellovibrionales bacterium]
MLTLLSSVFLAAAFAAHPPAVSLQSLPPDVRRVVGLSSQLVENQLQTQIQGSTNGAIVADVQLELRNGFHVYADRVDMWTESDSWLDGREWNVEILSKPTVVRFVDPISHTLKEGFTGQSIFKVKLTPPTAIQKPLPLGHKIPLVVYFQACSEKSCLLPVAAQVAISAAPNSETPPPQESFIERAVQVVKTHLGSGQISALALLVIFLAGVITAFTPCVYPLYPVTLGIFARWSAKGHANPLELSLGYCAGLTLSYALVGLVTVATGAVFGSLTQTAPFLLGVGILILGSAIFFSGLLTFPIPGFLMRFFTKGESPDVVAKEGRLQIFGKSMLMGAGLGIVASPCVGPVLVAILAWISATGANLSKGFFLLALFGAGMSAPFLALGYVILHLGKRPSLGRYTPHVKHAGTALMVLASLFFLVPGFQMIRGSSANHEAPKFKIATLETWTKSKWTVMDFRADWCAACVELERETFADKRIAPLFTSGEWEMVRVDMTQPDDKLQALAQSWGVVSLPSVLFFAPGGKPCPELSLHAFENAKDFLRRIESAPQNCH